jgi:hypothetical protein
MGEPTIHKLTEVTSLKLVLKNCRLRSVLYLAVDEGSYEPDQKLQKVRQAAEEALKIAHSLKLVKTKEEAEADVDSD